MYMFCLKCMKVGLGCTATLTLVPFNSILPGSLVNDRTQFTDLLKHINIWEDSIIIEGGIIGKVKW